MRLNEDIKPAEAWQKLYEQINSLKKDSLTEFEVSVDGSYVINDVSELRYFLAVAKRLYMEGTISENRKLILQVNIDSLVARRKIEVKERILAFLGMKLDIDYIGIRVGNRLLAKEEGGWQWSVIFPVCEATADGADGSVDYRILKLCMFDQKQGKNIQKGGFLAEVANIMLDKLQDIGLYKGTTQCPISQEQKYRLNSSVNEYLRRYLNDMDILSQIIWLYFLIMLLESGELIDLEKYIIHEAILNKTRMDAESYAEGMYQTIENSCQHSSGKSAWFGFRIHRARRIAAMNDMEKEAQRRYYLYNKYRECFKGTEGGKLNDIFNDRLKNYGFYFEFYVLDYALKGKGITATFNEENEQSYGHIYDVVHRKCKDKATGDPKSHVEDVVMHYGLRLLQRIVTANDGYLMGISPMGNRMQYYYSGRNCDNRNEANSVVDFTEWNVILPISFAWDNEPIEQMSVEGTGYCFGDNVLRAPDSLVYVSDSDIFAGLDEIDIGKKAEQIWTIEKNLEKFVLSSQQGGQLFLFHPEADISYLEIFAKGLFSLISLLACDEKEDVCLRIALLMPNVTAIHEFIRFYSAYYFDGIQADMRDVQIALCMESTLYEGTYTVQFILEGEAISDAFKNAQQFAYHEPEDAVEHLPMLKYLMMVKYPMVGDDTKEYRKNPVFPFDLYLPQSLPTTSKILALNKEPGSETWFVRRIKKVLETDLRQKEYGCSLSNIHIRLGSKIHVDRFYEAEMLFHDTGNVARFAYLIAQELIFGNKTPLEQGKNVLLIGNGKYSASLILQIQHWLEEAGKYGNVFSAVVYDRNEEGEVAIRRYFQDRELQDSSKSVMQVVTILPVGTTLSTVYKMLNAAKKEFSSVLEFREGETKEWNYCLILVNSDLAKAGGNGTSITNEYWELINRAEQTVTVKQEEKTSKGDRRTEVNYLIPLNANWYDPENCPICKKRGSEIKPLIRGRHSNTVPASIFSLSSNQYSLRELEVDEQNGKRIEGLFHNIRYSHLYSANNHFQFYIDHQDFYEQNSSEINEWLSKCTVNRNAYHVLISPLQITNSGFLKAVIDYVFEGCVSLVHFDIKDAYREEVRSKFSYITESYRRVKRENHNARFCIHFADTSIVTGTSLNRVRLLLNMLLSQSDISKSEVCYFDKIFLLVNRCHYDTINNFVRDPQNDLYAYVNLKIPSYNTENDFCPACRLREKYALLGKRSSTQILWDEFSRLSVKHTKREKEEYLDWRRSKLRNSSSDFSSFVQYLQVCVPDVDAEDGTLVVPFSYAFDAMNNYYGKMPQAYSEGILDRARGVKKVIREYFSEYLQLEPLNDKDDLQRYSNQIRKTCLEDVIRFAGIKSLSDPSDEAYKEFAEHAVGLMIDQMTSVRDYMRLVSMEEAYEALDKLSGNPDKTGDAYQEEDIRKRRDVMVNLIASKCVVVRLPKEKPLKDQYKDLIKFKEDASRETFALAYSVEWAISYVKVLSREQLASYYNNRCAISGIMSDMLSLVSETLTETNRKKFTDGLKKENASWRKIIGMLDAVCNQDRKAQDSVLKINFQYQIYMTLLHRMSDQQIAENISGDEIYQAVKLYYGLCDRFLNCTKKGMEKEYLLMALPTVDKMVLRYLKSLKLASMVSNDMVPGLKLTSVPYNLINKRSGEPLDVQDTLLLFARYIYLENTQVLYQGMRNLQKRVLEEEGADIHACQQPQDFRSEFDKLRSIVKIHLEECYENLDGEGKQVDVLKQNILSNFCIFWHRSMGCAPVSNKEEEDNPYEPLDQITVMLMYYRNLDSISDNMHEKKQEDIPYYYEELCRCMCMVTGFAMCYIAYDEDGSNSEIFTQSGYHTDMFLKKRLLGSEGLNDVLYRAREIWRNEFGLEKGQDGKARNNFYNDIALTPNIAVLSGNSESDYLIIRLQANRDDSYETGFNVIFQSAEGSGNAPDSEFVQDMLQKARNILFMREKLQKILTRDYAVLKGFRFDCTYVRKLWKENRQEGAAALHLSDLHIHSDVTGLVEEVREAIKYNLEEYKASRIDLLVVSGDIIDGRDANASAIEKNYGYAETLLKNVAVELWEDKSGYLPHDWKKRVIVTTGNHDYASVNQYSATQRHRLLTAAMPSETDSNTMAKFTYYIEFLVRFLDKPVDELLRNDLNEIRYYRRMNLKVIALNCSGKATPQRTNKIGVNGDKLEPLLRQARWRESATAAGEEVPFRLCVAHYSPEYKLSYFMDSYSDTIPGWEWNPEENENCKINILVNLFCELMHLEIRDMMMRGERLGVDVEKGRVKKKLEDELSNKRDEYLQFMGQLDLTLMAMENGSNINTVMGDKVQGLYRAMMRSIPLSDPGLNEKAKNEVDKMRKCELFRHMEMYRKWLNNNCDTSDEQMMRVMYQITQSLEMSESDKADFEKLVDHVVNDVKSDGTVEKQKIDLYLAGHVHSYVVSTSSGAAENILVADRLYHEGIHGINGFIITDMRVPDGGKRRFQYRKLKERKSG